MYATSKLPVKPESKLKIENHKEGKHQGINGNSPFFGALSHSFNSIKRGAFLKLHVYTHNPLLAVFPL